MTKLLSGCLVLSSIFAATGCGPKYVLKASQAESPVLSGDCALRVLDRAPDAAYSIVGTVEPEDPAKLALTQDDFLTAVRGSACRHGANAIIALQDATGRFSSGTAISLR